MSERDYHDRHYEGEADRIQGTPLFSRVHDRAAWGFLAATGVGRTHRVLSLGCGDGSIERRLAPHVAEIVGIDVSPVAIEHARERAKEDNLENVSFLVSEPDGLKLQGLGRFDSVVAFAFLHHLSDAMIRDTFAAALGALKPGGVFYSSDPSHRRLIGFFSRLVRATYDRYHSPDERELVPEALLAMAKEAGYTESKIAYVDYFLGPLAWLAPGTPRAFVPILSSLDGVALSVPVLKRFASSFSLTARRA